MVTLRMNIRQLPGWLKKLHRQYPIAVRTGLRAAASKSQQYITSTGIEQAQPYPPVDRGMYRRAWKVQRTPEGAKLYNSMPYAAIIEYGRRPGGRLPPVDILAEWVRRKLGVKNKKEAQGIAWAIARKIASKGTAPRYVLLNSMPAIRQFVNEETRLAIAQVTGT